MEPDVTVREVMDREFVGVSESDGVAEAAELMLSDGAESVVVLRGSEPVGVMTERDALAAFVAHDDPETVAEAMTDAVPTVSPNLTIAEAADEMSAAASRHLLVTEGDDPVGVLSEHDLITTSPFAPAVGDVDADVDRAVAGVSPGRGEGAPGELAGDETGDRARAAEFEDQSICETCGALSRDLRPFNGQLLCADCRDI